MLSAPGKGHGRTGQPLQNLPERPGRLRDSWASRSASVIHLRAGEELHTVLSHGSHFPATSWAKPFYQLLQALCLLSGVQLGGPKGWDNSRTGAAGSRALPVHSPTSPALARGSSHVHPSRLLPEAPLTALCFRAASCSTLAEQGLEGGSGGLEFYTTLKSIFNECWQFGTSCLCPKTQLCVQAGLRALCGQLPRVASSSCGCPLGCPTLPKVELCISL